MADQAAIVARLDHVGLAVGDLQAAVSWFCDVFGLVPELSLRVDALDLSIEMLAHPTLGYRLELLHRPGSGAARKPANPAEAALREGYGHVAFDITDLDAGYDRAVARGARPVMPPGPSPEAGSGWRSSPIRRATSSSSCTGRRGQDRLGQIRSLRADNERLRPARRSAWTWRARPA